MMRMLLLVMLMGWGCADPFVDAQEANTIEAYETFVNENPNSPFLLQGQLRLEELYLEKARTDKTLEAYDAYLERYTTGKLWEKAVEERRTFLFNWAEDENTAAAWQKYIDEYPKGNRKMMVTARTRLQMAAHRDAVGLGPVTMEMVNLAEDPDGPLNGYGFFVDVTNNGDKPISKLVLSLSYLGENGNVLSRDEWPAVATRLPGNLPMEEGFADPILPGQDRVWEWTTGDVPAGWTKKTSIAAVAIELVGEE